jgi:hypothetical protein
MSELESREGMDKLILEQQKLKDKVLKPSYKWADRCNELNKENSLLKKENKELKNILKEIKGKLHYINTPKNQHNVFGNDFMKRLDDLFKTENEE